MKTYNPTDFKHILKGSEVFINKGLEYTKSLSMPEKLTFADPLMYQLGEALESGIQEDIDSLYAYCVELSNDLKTNCPKYYQN